MVGEICNILPNFTIIIDEGNKARPRYKEVNVGQDVTFKCNPRGFIHTWIFDNGPIPNLESSKQLTIKNVENRHSGIYKCYYIKTYENNIPVLSLAELKVFGM